MTGENPRFNWREAEKELLAGIDTSIPHSARVWNYWLGGRDNYPVDQEAGEQYMQIFPGIVDIARLSRQFHTRVVRYLAGDAGIDQFLDIGTGLPTADNTHEVAQRVNPACKIVYVDNDPLVLAHARALLTSTPQGETDYIHADLHEPDHILDHANKILDFDRPIGLMLMAILGHIVDYDEARAIVRRLLAELPAGSYLVIADGANVITEEFNAAQDHYDEGGSVPYRLRDADQVARFFDGTDLLDPGLVRCPLWRPEGQPPATLPEVQPLGGVGRKT